MKYFKTIICVLGYVGYLCSHAAVVTDSIPTYPNDSIIFSDLKEITVLGKHPGIVISADKISYRPSEIISGNQSNIYETIKSVPGITIDSKGQIKANGVQNLTIYLDGTKTLFSGEELVNYLKSIPSSNIEKVEIENFSSARNDGSDHTLILNLIRRNKKTDNYMIGLNSDGQIWKARQSYESIFAEYNRESHNFYAYYSNYLSHNPSELLVDRPYVTDDKRMIQDYDRLRKDMMHQISFSYIYKPSSEFTLSTTLNYNRFRRNEIAQMTTTIPVAPHTTTTNNNATFITNNLYGELYLKKNIPVSNSNWAATFNFFRYKNSERQIMDDDKGRSVDGDMSGNNLGLVGTFDFDKSISPNWQILLGSRISYLHIKSDGIYSDYHSSISKKKNNNSNSLGSGFSYKENVNSVYCEAQALYGIWKINGGFRIEQNNLLSSFSGNETASSHKKSRNFFHIFPSLSIFLSLPHKGSWMISYANKISRPRFSDLDPFIHPFDDITHVGGNINLKEGILHNLSLVWTNDKWLRITISGEHYSNEIIKYYKELSEKIVYVTPENIPQHLQLMLSAGCFNLQVTPWWNTAVSANLIYSNYRFPKQTDISDNNRFTPVGDFKSLFNLPYNISAEIRASWRGRLPYGQAFLSSNCNTFIGFKKTFSNGKFSISLYLKDIFNSNHFNSFIKLADKTAIIYEKEFENMRKIGLSFSYQINGGIKTSKIEKRNAWIDELNRVNL